MSVDMNSKLIALLDQNNADYRLIEHKPEGRTEYVSKMRGNELKQAANCIVAMVKVGKKVTKFVLAVYPAHLKLDLDALKKLYEGTYVSFASPAKAEELAGSPLGTVLPFAFHESLELIVDPLLLENDEIFFNAARLDQSVALKASDYAKISNPRLESIAQRLKSQKSQVDPQEHDNLSKMRHSLAHVLAQAILNLYPETKYSIGPPIQTGCYYDFLFKEALTDAAFSKIEKEMRRIINKGQTFEVDSLTPKDAKAFWKKQKQPFKVEIIEDLEKEGATEVTNYKNIDTDGKETFVDLCRGGHVENLKEIPADAFKIMSLAGAYWRGDEKRDQLTRVYIAAFKSKQDLKDHIALLEEAKKRDHRVLGKALDLFMFSDLVGPGLPLWTPRGTIVRSLLDDFVWQLRQEKGYVRVVIPHISKKELYETSGHWQKFADELFRINTRENHEFAMKPMNCPHHVEIYKHLPRSYKHLPQRYAETTAIYRDEQTGELHGLARVRSITQDDAHVFCRMTQVKEEFLKIWDIVDTFYKTVGFGEMRVRLSLHDPNAFEKYLGTPEIWEKAENDLRDIAHERGCTFDEAIGEAAFYGPKVDFMTSDSLGREWQVATIQLDINMPERFDLTCTNEKGEKERIVMIHAAIMGALERFLSIYIEHINGHFPLWLAPVQATILPVTSEQEAYAHEVFQRLSQKGIRAEVMDASLHLGKRVREGEKMRIPYLLVLGEKECSAQEVNVRNVSTKNEVPVSLEKFLKKTVTDIEERRLTCSIG